ncbi:sciellin isoform X1 [Simochromis diagramma]|uniref:sciellin isoform X1 n=1 Tax=Simochromis diagramma TaxID=43689 RepID=UPI001A7EDE4B|nr:sciellin isoform X1 [Simochromis diagramma]
MSAYKTGKTSLLKDNSWIRKPDDEEEPVDQDPNFAKSVLGQYKSNETLASLEPEEETATKPSNTATSVQELSKRFGGKQNDLKTNTPSSTKTSYTKSTYSSVKADSPTVTTTTKTTVTEYPKTSTKTTTVTKDGSTTETTTTTTQSVKSPVTKTPISSGTFSDRVRTSSKGQEYQPYSPTLTTPKVTETTVTLTKDTEDKVYDTHLPSSIQDDLSPTESKTTISTTKTVTVKSSTDTNAKDQLYDTLIPGSVKADDSKSIVSTTKTVTVKSSYDDDVFKAKTPTKTSFKAEDQLYDTLLPTSIRSDSSSPVSSSSVKKTETVTVESSRGGESPSPVSTSSTRSLSSYSSYSSDIPSTRTTSYTITTSDDYSSNRNTYTYSRPDSSYEYTSITSPSVYSSTSYRSRSRSDDILSEPTYSKSSVKSAYAAPERTVLEKDLCTVCRKPFTGDAKMVLDDINMKCHASCFKCEVCNITLGNLKAGDSLWIYKRMVHCSNCFEVTKEKWRR